MDLEKFIGQRPYLYHLTSRTNAPNIVEQKCLLSANNLIVLSAVEENQKIQREKRKGHVPLIVNGKEISLRDQRPISEKALTKCLTDGWNVADFLHHLNSRVFMWPTLDRLIRHFNRYAQEEPVIFRFATEDLIRLNQHVKFCRLNSGATRANSYLGGKPPERGLNTFLTAPNFNLPIGQVAEVTFEERCNLPDIFYQAKNPEGPYLQID